MSVCSPHTLKKGVSEDVIFAQVVTVKDLYEKLWMVVDGFKAFMGDEESDDEDGGRAATSSKSSSKSGGAAPTQEAIALARLIDAGEGAEEHMLEEQLRHVQPVQIAARTHMPGKCIECEDRQAILDCVECEDEFCGVCFSALHRKGRRAHHKTASKPGFPPFKRMAVGGEEVAMQEGEECELEMPLDLLADDDAADEADFTFRARFIPVRLAMKERTFLRLLEAQLSVSTYTDAIDRPDLKANNRVHQQILKVCAFLSGIAVSIDYEKGGEIVQSRKWREHEPFFRNVLEVGRRHKILNPDRMRTEYGRLMYMMMDAKKNDVQQLLGFDVAKPIVTVYERLKEAGADALLRDPRVEIATRAIDQMDQMTEEARKKSRQEIRREVKDKEAAVKALARQYRNSKIDEEEIKGVLSLLLFDLFFVLFVFSNGLAFVWQ